MTDNLILKNLPRRINQVKKRSILQIFFSIVISFFSIIISNALLVTPFILIFPDFDFEAFETWLPPFIIASVFVSIAIEFLIKMNKR